MAGHFSFSEQLEQLDNFYWKKNIKIHRVILFWLLDSPTLKGAQTQTIRHPAVSKNIRALTGTHRYWFCDAPCENKKQKYNFTATFFDKINSLIYFVSSCSANSARDVSTCFIHYMFCQQRLPASLVLVVNTIITSHSLFQFPELCISQLIIST